MNRLIASPQTPAALLEQQATLQWLVAGFMKSFREDLQARMDQIRRFGPVVEYIHQHLDAPIAIPTLARLASLHPNYFSNLFTASFGESPREYILNKRIERAQLLLWQTERPLKQIADAVGYDNVPYFCRLFKQRTGLTPGTYRSQR
jgi:AraC-like DNA-binding protein